MKDLSLKVWKSVLAVVLGLVAGALFSVAAEAKEYRCGYYPPADLVDQVRKLKVGDTGHGTGFAYTKNLTLTAHHIVSDKASEQIVSGNLDKDLVLLNLRLFRDPLPIAREDLSLGDTVWAIGYPGEAQKQVTRGIVLGFIDHMAVSDLLVAAGMSGGPVLKCEDGKFKVAGIVHAYISRSNPLAQSGRGMFVRTKVLRNFLQEYESSVSLGFDD